MTHIRSIRKDTLGLSQEQLADVLGVDQATISRLERGVQPLDERTRLALEALVRRKEAGEPINEAA